MKRNSVFCLTIFILSMIACVGDPAAEGGDIGPSQSGRIDDSFSNSDTMADFTVITDDSIDGDRTYWQRPQLVIRSLGDLSGKTVADLGAGSGYFTWRMLPLVGKVIAIDIDPYMIDYLNRLKSELDTAYKPKVEVRLAWPDDSNLGVNEVDVIFLSNTYAYIDNRIEYFRDLRHKLTKSGRIVIVDFKRKIIPLDLDGIERLPLFQVEQELIEAGYEIVSSDDRSLPYQYILQVTPAGR